MTDKLKGFQIASETESDGNNVARRASQYNNEVSKRMENTQEKFHKVDKEEEKCKTIDKLLVMQEYHRNDQSQGGGINPNKFGDSEDPQDKEKNQDHYNQRLSTVTVSEGKMDVARDYVGLLMENVRIMTKPENQIHELEQPPITSQGIFIE